jgi:hypothetical protein
MVTDILTSHNLAIDALLTCTSIRRPSGCLRASASPPTVVIDMSIGLTTNYYNPLSVRRSEDLLFWEEAWHHRIHGLPM